VIYELRQYRIRKGKMKEWVKLFEAEVLPFQLSKGMVVCGVFTAPSDPTLFVWIRRFRSAAQKKRLYDRVYGHEHWKNVLSPKIGKLLDRTTISVTELLPTSLSVLA
jgi:hypothetical protein